MSSVQRWIAFFGGCSLFFVLMGLFWFFRGAIARRREQLAARLMGDQPPARIRTRQPREREVGVLQLLLQHAAIGINPQGFLAICAGAVLFVVLAGSASLGNLPAGLVLGCLAAAAIFFVIRLRAERQIQTVARQLPSALEMMTLGLRAGRSLEEAIQLAAEQGEAPLSTELWRCHQECSMGKSVEQTLAQLGDRWQPVHGIGLFVEAVSVLKQTGGNLVEVLDSIRTQVRAREAYETKHRAMTSEGRISGRILMLLPLCALAAQVLMSPAELRAMLGTDTGQTLLLVAGLLWAVGVVWVMKLTRPARY